MISSSLKFIIWDDFFKTQIHYFILDLFLQGDFSAFPSMKSLPPPRDPFLFSKPHAYTLGNTLYLTASTQMGSQYQENILGGIPDVDHLAISMHSSISSLKLH
jgi:hypothetical protein